MGASFDVLLTRPSALDSVIVALGVVLVVAQLASSLPRLVELSPRVEQIFRRYRQRLEAGIGLAIELLPILGLLGTVSGLLGVFAAMAEGGNVGELTAEFVPALTSTFWGLFWLGVNIGVAAGLSIVIGPAQQE